jgi:hypothetical protein
MKTKKLSYTNQLAGMTIGIERYICRIDGRRKMTSEWEYRHRLGAFSIKRGLEPERVMQIAGGFANWSLMLQYFPDEAGTFEPAETVRIGKTSWHLACVPRCDGLKGYTLRHGTLQINRAKDPACMAARSMAAVDWAWNFWRQQLIEVGRTPPEPRPVIPPPQFLGFAQITDDDAFPVILASESSSIRPCLYDHSPEPEWLVHCHSHFIEISPQAADRDGAVAQAIEHAKKTYTKQRPQLPDSDSFICHICGRHYVIPSVYGSHMRKVHHVEPA